MGSERRDGTRYYVYAIAEQAPRRFKVGQQTLRTIEAGGTAAIVEVVAGAIRASEEALRAQHALVVRLARRFDALLPVRFGAVFTESDLRARLEADQEALRDRLAFVRGRVQMTVRIHAAFEQPPSRRNTTGTEYLAARRESGRALERMAAQIRTAVAPFVADERVDSGRADVLGTVYHLVKMSDVAPYQKAVSNVADAFTSARLTITGPWPVFAFSGGDFRESNGTKL